MALVYSSLYIVFLQFLLLTETSISQSIYDFVNAHLEHI